MKVNDGSDDLSTTGKDNLVNYELQKIQCTKKKTTKQINK